MYCIDRLTIVYAVLAVVALGCADSKHTNKESPTTAKSVESSSAQVAKPATAPKQDTTATAATSSDDIKALCSSPCQLLTVVSLKELAGDGYCNLCGGDACSGTNPFAQSSCDEHDFLRNCVYASHGYKFKKAKWQQRFGSLDWYEPGDSFSESSFSKLEWKNIATLRNRAGFCAAKTNGSKVTAKDRELVTGLIKKLKSGGATFDSLSLFVESGEKVGADAFVAYFDEFKSGGYFDVSNNLRFEYLKKWVGDRTAKDHRVVAVYGGTEQSEGSDWNVKILVDAKGQIASAYLFAL